MRIHSRRHPADLDPAGWEASKDPVYGDPLPKEGPEWFLIVLVVLLAAVVAAIAAAIVL